jgi:trans-aconitate 2-methyltransferase
MAWDPAAYLTFEKERAAPFVDCLALVDKRPGLRVIDLGCGTGHLTAQLADVLPGSDVLGVDTSAEMLAEAPARPGLRFEPRAIEAVEGQWDLVFSHAAIHWVDDHKALVPRLFGLVAPGGQLVVQLPSNHWHPAQVEMRAAAAELTDFRRASPVLTIADYAELLHAAGGSDLTVLEKVYPHVLPDADAVAAFTSSTALLPYLAHLSDDGKQALRDRYVARLRALWPKGPVFFGFRRIIFAAKRA